MTSKPQDVLITTGSSSEETAPWQSCSPSWRTTGGRCQDWKKKVATITLELQTKDPEDFTIIDRAFSWFLVESVYYQFHI